MRASSFTRWACASPAIPAFDRRGWMTREARRAITRFDPDVITSTVDVGAISSTPPEASTRSCRPRSHVRRNQTRALVKV